MNSTDSGTHSQAPSGAADRGSGRARPRTYGVSDAVSEAVPAKREPSGGGYADDPLHGSAFSEAEDEILPG